MRRTIPALLLVSGWVALLLASDTKLTPQQKEEFLRTAKITRVHGAPKGITGSLRVTMSDGTITHDVHVQTIDDYKSVYKYDDGRTEMNFRDTYKFNIAAWRLACALGIDDMTPPSVERHYEGKSAAFTWWVDDTMMDEVDRVKKKLKAPDSDEWNDEVGVMRVFDQLILNVDRNMQNIIMDKDWHIWLIDHTRAFRAARTVPNAKVLTRCDRDLLEKMKGLDQTALEKTLMPYVTKDDIKNLLFRRDQIVKIFEAKGEPALYTRSHRL